VLLQVDVIPVRELHYNDDDYYGIYACDFCQKDDFYRIIKEGYEVSKYGNITIKGTIPKLELNKAYTVVLLPDIKSKYKGSYDIAEIIIDVEIPPHEQKNFLKTILTENQVKNIYEVYTEEDDIIQLIKEDKFDYEKVKHMNKNRYENMKKKVLESVNFGELYAFLGKYDIKISSVIKTLINEYKYPKIIIEKIKENPYMLTKIKGIGFERADKIAQSIGYDLTSPNRIVAGIHYAIEEENNAGHVWVDYKKLLNKAIDLLKINNKIIEDFLNNFEFEEVLRIGDRFTFKYLYEIEKNIATKLKEMASKSNKIFTDEELEQLLDDYCERHGVQLEENQRKFFFEWNNHNVVLLIGYGGTGKSWLQQILLEFLKNKGINNICLLSPTGKASKVMTNYTGMEAYTIHRRLGIRSDDSEDITPIVEDVVIVDETSMCDIFIINKLLNAIENKNTKLLFVGDDFQLPSVRVGNFLYDIIHSGIIPVVRLNKVFRQKDGGILEVATNVREQKYFLKNTDSGRKVFGKDCLFHLVVSDYMEDGYIHYYKKLLTMYNPEDIVVLSPTKKGKLGTIEINKKIQEIVNPPSEYKKEKAFGKKNQITFRVGDLVMNTENTYNIKTIDDGVADVFNGDTGIILDIDEEEKVMIIDFDGIVVKMNFEGVTNNIIHAWATTIHKSQGSQYKAVIVIIDKSMKFQLNANLIYTAFSRAKDYMIVLGQANSINYGMTKFANMERRSFLQEFLVEV